MLAKRVLWLLNTSVKVKRIGCAGWGRLKRLTEGHGGVERRQSAQAGEGPRGGLCGDEERFHFLITEAYLGKSSILGNIGVIAWRD